MGICGGGWAEGAGPALPAAALPLHRSAASVCATGTLSPAFSETMLIRSCERPVCRGTLTT